MKATTVKPDDMRSPLPDGFTFSPLNTWQLVSKPRSYTAWLREKYRDVVTLSFQNNKFGRAIDGDAFVVALSPEGARQILSAEPDGYDAFWKVGFTGVAGTGSLWVLAGEKHQRERRMLGPSFHAHNFRGYGETIRQITRKQISGWREGQTLRAMDTTLAISLEVILQLVIGIREESSIQEARKVLTKLRDYMHPLIVFFPQLQRRWFPLWARYHRAKNEYMHWISQYLDDRRKSNAKTDDVLGRMLEARYEDGSCMRDEDIQDELVTILLAGHETTATALAWALYELGRNPEIVEKLRAELDSLGSTPETESIARLPYLSAVCNETLRLHTLLPEIARVLTSPLQLFGYRIPAGNSVAISVMAIHHDPELYPEPDEFLPDRFMQKTYSPFEFLPFGGGHRRCLGAGLSDYEMRIALAEIIMHWDFESAAIEREIRHDIAMGPRNGVRLRIKARRNAS